MTVDNYDIVIGSATDTGIVRAHNEDFMAHFDTPAGYCILVCDGMGGHAAGEVASENAAGAIRQFLQDKNNTSTNTQHTLKNAIEFANYHLREMITDKPELKGMGTTCAIALITDGRVYIAHAGDSRIYLVHKGRIKQVTKDHSAVQNMIDNGVLTVEEAELSSRKNEIAKAIGIFEKVDPTITELTEKLVKDDVIMICSDGLTGLLKNEVIAATIVSIEDVEKAATRLVELANEAGGYDNITVQLVQYTLDNSIKEKRKNTAGKRLVLMLIVAGLICLFVWVYHRYFVTVTPTPPVKNKNVKQSK